MHATLFSHEPVKMKDYEPWMYLQALPKEEPTAEPTAEPKAEPTAPRSLFACLYSLVPDAVPLTKHVEIQQKLALVKWAADNRTAVLAATKLSSTKLQEYTADVMSSAPTTWGGLYLWCHFYKLNVRVVGNVLFMDFVGMPDQEEVVHILYQNKTFRFGQGTGKWQVDFRQASPLKAIGHYKVDELKAVAATLGVAADRGWKKKDWYEAIYKTLVW